MASQVQESLLKAIDILINNRVEKLAMDKTVTGIIVACTNSLTGEYKISYNGGYMWAYAQPGNHYQPNAEVYVLVPEGDFSQKKIIVDQATLSEEDANISFVSSALNDYSILGNNTIINADSIGLYSYKVSDYYLLYERNGENNHIQFNSDDFKTYIQNAEALMIESSFQTRLPKEHRLSKTGIYGVQFVLAFKDGDATDEDGNPQIKYLSYTIDTNNMTGNPYLFNSWADQYAIFPIDTENFLYVDSIMAFSQGFVTEDNEPQITLYGADIFVKDLEIYGLKKITGINGDYRLSVNMPQGAIFKTLQETEILDVVAKVDYQINQDLSDATMFYWFSEDGRITTSSEDYQMYGGVGWRRLKSKGVNKSIVLNGSENRAAENHYLCVAVYKESVILKEYFTIYNDAADHTISIESNLGLKFSFDRGTPTLTCLINGRSENFEEEKDFPHDDKLFNFVWSKVDAYGQTTIFNQTKEELEQAYEEGIRNGYSYSELVAIKNKIASLEDVIFTPGKNTLTYPVKQIDSTATFKCSVYLKDDEVSEEYSIGDAEITLQNDSAATPTDYYILIENGEQVFQYSESGVSPDSERYQDPLKILPLTCHFYDPAGLEVNPDTYNIKWKVPSSSTLIVAPKEGMILNPSTNKIEWYTEKNYPTAIAANYDYQALDNQITCIVTYKDIEYTKDTRFYFGKVGDNGTNGTDMVAKISPASEIPFLDSEMLTLELLDGVAQQWNTGQNLFHQVLDFDLYQRNELVSTKSVSWSMTDKRTTYMSVNAGIIDWNHNAKALVRSQIVRATTRVEGQDYYAFYTIPVIDYKDNISGDGKSYHIGVDTDYTLKQILYNADGRNPLYNKNQGVKLNLSDKKFIVWTAEGGINNNITSCSFKLMKEKNNAKSATDTLIPAKIDETDEEGNVISSSWEDLSQIYILPDDIYDGMYTNNLVHGVIYSDNTVYENGGNPEAEVWVPIHMALNTFGLASLNAWDGNHIEINEEDNYILAPQIGAGEKDTNNRFTGVVMGTSQTYDADSSSVGLLGYSHGKQSIWLDADTGNAIFGLPEQEASANNNFTEGRIELIPGGESRIGMWHIGSRAIYNMTEPPDMRTIINEDDEQIIQILDNEGNWVDLADGTILENKNFKGVDPITPAYSGYHNSSKYNVANAPMSIPPTAQGMILGANPAYLSVKSMPLTRNNSNIVWDDANTTLKQGDSLEVEIDPVKSSVFSIYRHTTYDGNQNTYRWRRYPLVGINANGQFYSNAVEDGESSMGIGKVGAFHDSAASQKYVGAQFGWKGTNLFKFFIDVDDEKSDERKTLYISTGSKVDTYDEMGNRLTRGNEYPRGINLYGDSFNLYTPDTGETSETSSSHKISLSSTLASIGHEKTYLTLGTTNGVNLVTDQSCTINIDKSKTETVKLNRTINISGNNNQTIGGTSTVKVTGNYTESTGKDYSLTSQHFNIKMLNAGTTNASQSRWGANNDKVYIQQNPTVVSLLKADAGWNIKSGNSYIDINSAANPYSIKIQATPPNGRTAEGTTLSLTSQNGGSGSDFNLSSPHGSVRSGSNVANNLNGIGITPGLSTPWLYVSGKQTGSDWGIEALQYIKGRDWAWPTTQTITGGDISASAQLLLPMLRAMLRNISQTITNKTNAVQQNLDNAVEALNKELDAVDVRIDNANSRIDNLDSSKSDKGHTHSQYLTSSALDSYVTKTAYASHRHSFSGTATVDGKTGTCAGQTQSPVQQGWG